MDQPDQNKALLLPFTREELALPERAFLMRAEGADGIGPEWTGRLVCEQSFKPAARRLEAAGFPVTPRLEGRFPAGLVLITKHKAEAMANLARAWTLIEPGGILVVCGAKALGAASIEREMERVLGLDGQMSKHQARVFWRRKDSEDRPADLDGWLAEAAPKPIAGEDGLVARAGCFSATQADAGSRLLIECLPEAVAGRVADLGAGWGYLSVQVARRRPAVTGLDLFEAEALALEDAKTNLSDLPASFHWWDVAEGMPPVSPPDVMPYDWIICNPPFHEGRRADPALGRAFITAAWSAIRRRGKFLLVANQALPYEAELRRRFREVEQLALKDGFKVYQCSNRHDR